MTTSRSFGWLNVIMDCLGDMPEDRLWLAEEMASYLLPFCVDSQREGETQRDTVRCIMKMKLNIT